MSDFNASGSANQAGSPGNGPAGTAGEPTTGALQDQYKNLEEKFGEQGRELGAARELLQSISPLLEKLDQRPDLIQAIIDDKLSEQIISAIDEGKISTEIVEKIISGDVTIKGAEAVTQQAKTEVKKEMGADAFKAANPEEIEALVNEKVAEIKGELENKFNESEQARDFAAAVNNFIEKTPDYAEYAQDINKYVIDHPEIESIETAYYAVKGMRKEADEKKNANEEAKAAALSAGGGSSQATTIIKDSNIVDQLISGNTSPNRFI